VNNIDLAKKIRVESLEMVSRVNASHIGAALSMVEILVALYGDNGCNVKAKNPSFIGRDRIILSKGHGCVSLYATLGVLGFFEVNDLKTYGLDDSIYMNHVSHKVEGVEFSTGSLGHGLSFGVGKALYAKKNKLLWNVYVIVGDGEMNEGSIWEALSFAAHNNLSNLTLIIDKNNLQSITTCDETLKMNLYEKCKAFGCDVYEVDGHNIEQLQHTTQVVSSINPKVIIAKTVKGKGVSFMEGKVEWHYKCPNAVQVKQAISEIYA
jgi:transketolase